MNRLRLILVDGDRGDGRLPGSVKGGSSSTRSISTGLLPRIADLGATYS